MNRDAQVILGDIDADEDRFSGPEHLPGGSHSRIGILGRQVKPGAWEGAAQSFEKPSAGRAKGEQMLNRFRVPVLGGAVALLIGVAIVLWTSAITGPRANWMLTMFALAVLYFLAGLVLGAIWPKASWAWGAWLITPFSLLLLLSLAFSGNIGAFVRYDLAPLLGVVIGALGGGVVGAVARRNLCRAEYDTGA